MSSFRPFIHFLRYMSFAIVAGLTITACQVRPLYGEMAGGSAQSIGISAPASRVAQIVRNELVFGFSGGAGEPANPQYDMDLDVSVTNQGVLPASNAGEFNAARIVVTASYTLRDTSSGERLFSGERRAVAALDNPDQEYGRTRAVVDAQNRAAREAAAFIRVDVVGKLASRTR